MSHCRMCLSSTGAKISTFHPGSMPYSDLNGSSINTLRAASGGENSHGKRCKILQDTIGVLCIPRFTSRQCIWCICTGVHVRLHGLTASALSLIHISDRTTPLYSSAASDVYKRQAFNFSQRVSTDFPANFFLWHQPHCPGRVTQCLCLSSRRLLAMFVADTTVSICLTVGCVCHPQVPKLVRFTLGQCLILI